MRLVGGFARAGNIKADQYLGAEVDPVAQYSAPICKHMNEDHAESVLAYAHYWCEMPGAVSARMHSREEREGHNRA